jgi:oligopeptidase B
MSSDAARPVPPVARKVPKTHRAAGSRAVDDYAWMKDDNWQKVLRDPGLIKADVKAHLTAENAYTKAMLASTEALQAAMFEEMKGRIKEDDASVPAKDGPFEYYTRFETGAQHPIHARKPELAGGGARRSCWTRRPSRRARPSIRSARPAIRRTTSSTPSPSTSRARKST